MRRTDRGKGPVKGEHSIQREKIRADSAFSGAAAYDSSQVVVERQRGKSPRSRGSSAKTKSPRTSPRTSPARRTPSPLNDKRKKNRGNLRSAGAQKSIQSAGRGGSQQRSSKGPSPATTELNQINSTHSRKARSRQSSSAVHRKKGQSASKKHPRDAEFLNTKFSATRSLHGQNIFGTAVEPIRIGSKRGVNQNRDAVTQTAGAVNAEGERNSRRSSGRERTRSNSWDPAARRRKEKSLKGIYGSSAKSGHKESRKRTPQSKSATRSRAKKTTRPVRAGGSTSGQARLRTAAGSSHNPVRTKNMHTSSRDSKGVAHRAVQRAAVEQVNSAATQTDSSAPVAPSAPSGRSAPPPPMPTTTPAGTNPMLAIDQLLCYILSMRGEMQKGHQDVNSMICRQVVDHLREQGFDVPQDGKGDSQDTTEEQEVVENAPRPNSGPPALRYGKVLNLSSLPPLDEVLRQLQILEGKTEATVRESFDEIEHEIRDQRSRGRSGSGTAGPQAVYARAIQKVEEYKQAGMTENKTNGREAAQAPGSKMFGSVDSSGAETSEYDEMEAELQMVGSPPKSFQMPGGVPVLSLDVIRSPVDEHVGTSSPDMTKQMLDISSPRSAFSRHSTSSVSASNSPRSTGLRSETSSPTQLGSGIA